MTERTTQVTDKARRIVWADLPRAAFKRASFRLRSMGRSLYLRKVLMSERVASFFPFRSPPILLLSYPRSGSSWVGDVLATSCDIAYLREPITRIYLDGWGETMPDVDRNSDARHVYQDIADKTFAGIPVAGEGCVRNLAPFAPLGRSRRHLLIKEVNPHAAAFFAERYAPMVLLLLRHPAAVAESFERMGWLKEGFEELGYHYGLSMANAARAILHLPHILIHYEDLAAAPESKFAELFGFLGVTPPPNFEGVIDLYCRQDGSDQPYETRRISAQQMDKWRTRLDRKSVDLVMAGVSRSGYLGHQGTDYRP